MIVFWDAVALNVKTINNISDKKNLWHCSMCHYTVISDVTVTSNLQVIS